MANAIRDAMQNKRPINSFLTSSMAGRLASFKSPSTPTSSPAKQAQQQSAAPLRSNESTYHRKVRTIMQELRTVAENWDDIVLVDGLKAAQSLIDARTELECVYTYRCIFTAALKTCSNELALVPAGTQPKHRIVEPKLSLMEKRIAQLDTVIANLVGAQNLVSPAHALIYLAEEAVPEDEQPGRFLRGRPGRSSQNQGLAVCPGAVVGYMVVGEI